jgi:hypothetical protein
LRSKSGKIKLHANAKAIGLCFVQLFSGTFDRPGGGKMPHLKPLHTHSTKSDTFVDVTAIPRFAGGLRRRLASSVQGAPAAVFQVALVGATT